MSKKILFTVPVKYYIGDNGVVMSKTVCPTCGGEGYCPDCDPVFSRADMRALVERLKRMANDKADLLAPLDDFTRGEVSGIRNAAQLVQMLLEKSEEEL